VFICPFVAPRPIARHLVIKPQPVQPTEEMPSAKPINGPYTRPPRESYPDDVLTHAFQPYGSYADEVKDDEDGIMDVDVEQLKEPSSKSEENTALAAAQVPPLPGKKSKEKKKKSDPNIVEVPPEQKNTEGAAEGAWPGAGVMDVDATVEVPEDEKAAPPVVKAEKAPKGKKRKEVEVVLPSRTKPKKVKTS
jgi:hypothetical protein